MISTLFGESVLKEDTLLSSFKQYISIDGKDLIVEMLETLEENNDALMDLLSSYKCYRATTTKDYLKDIIIEIAHQ